MDLEGQDKRVQALLAQEQAWTQAHLKFDKRRLEAILSDSFVKLDADGQLIDKEQLLASYDPNVRRWQIAESRHHQVWIQGQVGIVAGWWRGKGANQGVPFDYRARFIAIYALEGGEWRLTSEHSVPVDENLGEPYWPAG